jgi:O-antigen/teichoic acid export membrane protein
VNNGIWFSWFTVSEVKKGQILERSISQKIIRNTIFNAIGRFWGILVALGLTPYIIGHIGVERYGIWAIVGVLTGYFGLLDFGIGASFVKYISEFYAKKDYGRINHIVNTGFVFYAIFAILITVLGVSLINPLLTFFKIPQSLYKEAVFVFLLGIILFGVSNTLSPFGAIQGGLQRMDISNKIAIVISIPSIAGTIFFLEKGYGLPGLMVNNAIILVISSVVNIIIAFKILPELRFNFFLFGKEMFKKLFVFGYKLQLAKIYSVITLSIDKLLITYFLSIGLVTFYQLGSSFVEGIKGILLLPVPALLPAFSEIDAKGEREKLIEGYTRITRYLSFIAIPLFIFIIVSASQIMMVWMGVGYERSARIIQILTVGHLCAILAGGVGNPILQAMARTEVEMKAGLINVIINLPLSIFLIIQFGFIGAAIGTMLSWIVASIYYFMKLHQIIHLPVGPFLRSTFLKTTILCLVLALPVWVVAIFMNQLLGDASRLSALIVLLIQALLFWSGYFFALFLIKPLDKVDIRLLHLDRFPGLRSLAANVSLR